MASAGQTRGPAIAGVAALQSSRPGTPSSPIRRFASPAPCPSAIPRPSRRLTSTGVAPQARAPNSRQIIELSQRDIPIAPRHGAADGAGVANHVEVHPRSVCCPAQRYCRSALRRRHGLRAGTAGRHADSRNRRHRADARSAGRAIAVTRNAGAGRRRKRRRSGTLPIVTDQFATVTVVPDEEIQRNGGATLGDLLINKPGITGSSFAPGASSRPIVRGLDANRVAHRQENGIGANGASDLGEDHVVPIDPLASDKVEVIRGPATLRYGSQAIGGVVSASNNRIPDCDPASAAIATEVQRRGEPASTTASMARCCVDAGKGNFAFHADVFGRTAGDYRIPCYPYLAARPGAGRSTAASRTRRCAPTASRSAARIFSTTALSGVAVSQNNALYHIPGIDGEDHNTRIDMQPDQGERQGRVARAGGVVDAIRFWWGDTDYKHNELGFADPANAAHRRRAADLHQQGTGRPRRSATTPVNLRFATLTTAVGVQGGASGADRAEPGQSGHIERAVRSEQQQQGRRLHVQRIQIQRRDQGADRRAHRAGQSAWRDAGLSRALCSTSPDLSPAVARDPNFTPKSVSFGVIQNLPWDLVGSVTAQCVERAPKPAELFSRGAHDATGTFDIGNPDLKIETAKSLEVGVRRAQGPLRFEATAYYTRFDDFIFRRLDRRAVRRRRAAGRAPATRNSIRRSIRSATRCSAAASCRRSTTSRRLWSGMWGVDGQYDIVRATFTDGTNVPRIPPQRLGGGVFWRDIELARARQSAACVRAERHRGE